MVNEYPLIKGGREGEMEVAWRLVANELKRKLINAVDAVDTDEYGYKSIWYMECSDGDLSELPTMLYVVECVLGVESGEDWAALYKSLNR